MGQPHLMEGLAQVTRALGGLTAPWRFDRMATVVHPESGRVTASFAAVAKHYGVSVRPCPPRRGNRKGVVEKANHVAAQRFWRTLPDDFPPEQAQQLLDTWCARRGDVRLRATADGKATVATLAAREPLRPAPPVPFPATLLVLRTVSAQALVSFRQARFATMNMPPNSGKKLLVFGCGCNVSDTHRNSAAEGGQLPGLPEERMPAGLVITHGRAHGARIAAQPARLSVPDARRRARLLAWRLRMRRR